MNGANARSAKRSNRSESSTRATVWDAMRFTTAVRFVDTNVLLYAVSRPPDGDQEAWRKRGIGLEILDRTDLALSVQVLKEFYVQATRPSRPDPLTHEQAADLIDGWLRYPVQETTVELLKNGLATCRRWQISLWDAAIIEAARALSCSVVLSEDLQHGMDFGGVAVQNPFRG